MVLPGDNRNSFGLCWTGCDICLYKYSICIVEAVHDENRAARYAEEIQFIGNQIILVRLLTEPEGFHKNESRFIRLRYKRRMVTRGKLCIRSDWQ